MEHFIKNWNKYLLKESSLSRLHQHISEHDTAVITAFRNDPSSSEVCVAATSAVEQEDPLKANKTQNKNLKAVLLRKGYGVTRVDGSYVENFDDPDLRKEVSEESFFVVNLKDNPEFIKDIEELGKMFCQDSVLLIPRGGREAYLLGTNETWPGLGDREPVGDFKGGEEAEFMSRVKRRPFVFKEISSQETYADLSRNSKWAVAKIAERVLNESR